MSSRVIIGGVLSARIINDLIEDLTGTDYTKEHKAVEQQVVTETEAPIEQEGEFNELVIEDPEKEQTFQIENKGEAAEKEKEG